MPKQRLPSRTRGLRRWAGLWTRAAVALTLAAFTLQSYLTQTHIHFAPAVERVLASADQPKSASIDLRQAKHPRGDSGHDPSSGDSANCPICQEMLSAGSYVTPTMAAVLPPTDAVSTIAVAEREPALVTALSHAWQGRAPPSA